ncbi:uncharacterized protein LOC141904573 [Tubulanus polymorphus]|uniref:uncharacterized protein LOC141904573 n=1 Tax=Tubulanus polymorphus TaxID=672921 RepID=UPI003DA4B890
MPTKSNTQMAEENGDGKYRALILDISRKLSKKKKEFDQLKFLMNDDIDACDWDEIDGRFTELCLHLEQQKLIGADNMEYLSTKLKEIKRYDLAELIEIYFDPTKKSSRSSSNAGDVGEYSEQFEEVSSTMNEAIGYTSTPVPVTNHPNRQNEIIIGEKTREAIEHLVLELGTDWKDLGRRLIRNCKESLIDSIIEENRKTKDRIRSMLHSWLQQDDPPPEQQAQLLETALRKCRLNRLASQISKIFYLETAL